MTDKEIIIDGVDVSGCEVYSKYREEYILDIINKVKDGRECQN